MLYADAQMQISQDYGVIEAMGAKADGIRQNLLRQARSGSGRWLSNTCLCSPSFRGPERPHLSRLKGYLTLVGVD